MKPRPVRPLTAEQIDALWKRKAEFDRQARERGLLERAGDFTSPKPKVEKPKQKKRKRRKTKMNDAQRKAVRAELSRYGKLAVIASAPGNGWWLAARVTIRANGKIYRAGSAIAPEELGANIESLFACRYVEWRPPSKKPSCIAADAPAPEAPKPNPVAIIIEHAIRSKAGSYRSQHPQRLPAITGRPAGTR